MPLFSIIIPVYNADRYIAKCLDSIRNQSFTDFEAIIVDDGSTDNSARICEEYTNADSRFIYIFQSNHGVSSARNAGLKCAKGEWISFVDSDDWVDSCYLSVFADIKEKADINFFGMTFADEDGNVTPESLIPGVCHTADRHTVEEALYHLRHSAKSNMFGWTWDKFFRSSIIKSNSMFFDENVSFMEDELFTLQYCCHIHSILTIGRSLYMYRVREGSLTRQGAQSKEYAALAHGLMPCLSNFSNVRLYEQLLNTTTAYLAAAVYATPIHKLKAALCEYQSFAASHPQPGIECKVNHLTRYLQKGFWAGYLYTLIRKL